MTIRNGSCLCGSVKYSVDGEMRDVVACHCSQCRKQSGHYFAATAARRDTLAIEGAGNITWFDASDDAKRGFCKTCGSVMFWDSPDRDEVSILAGSLDGDTGLKIARHIYVEDKGDYYEINGDVPQDDQADNFSVRFS